MVVVIDPDWRTFQGFDGSREAAFELIIVVAVENVVLAIVLILENGVEAAQARLEGPALGTALQPRAIGILPPLNIAFRELVLALPNALIDQRLKSRAIFKF